MPYLLCLKKGQNLKLLYATNYRWHIYGLILSAQMYRVIYLYVPEGMFSGIALKHIHVYALLINHYIIYSPQ